MPVMLLTESRVYTLGEVVAWLQKLPLTSVNVKTKILQYHNTYAELTSANNASHTDKVLIMKQTCVRIVASKKSQFLPIWT